MASAFVRAPRAPGVRRRETHQQRNVSQLFKPVMVRRQHRPVAAPQFGATVAGSGAPVPRASQDQQIRSEGAKERIPRDQYGRLMRDQAGNEVAADLNGRRKQASQPQAPPVHPHAGFALPMITTPRKERSTPPHLTPVDQ